MKGTSPEPETIKCICCEKEFLEIDMFYGDDRTVCWACAESYFSNQNSREDDRILKWDIKIKRE